MINLLSSDETGATMTEIAKHLDINQASCVHMLAALTTAGFLFREPSDRRYHLGPALVLPGRVAASRYPELATARTEMEALSRAFGRPCFAFSREGDHARLMHYTWDQGGPTPGIRLGDTVPMVPPLGAMFFAWEGATEITRWLALDRTMDRARSDRYRKQLVVLRRRGYVVEAQPSPRSTSQDDLSRTFDDRPSPQRDGELYRLLVDHGENEHVLTDIDPATDYLIHAIGAPIFDRNEAVDMSFTMIGFFEPISGKEIQRIAAAVRAAADRTTTALGGVMPSSLRRART
ncbi:helix-turn-helix domain-containing protein [soil metagenome]